MYLVTLKGDLVARVAVLTAALAQRWPQARAYDPEASVESARESDGQDWYPMVGRAVHLTTLVAGERLRDDADDSMLSVSPQWRYHVWDHADTSPVAVSSGNPAILGGIYCTEAFGGTPNPILQDGTTALWAVDTATALRASVIEPLRGIWCQTDLRLTSSTAGSAGKLVIKWRPLA